MYWSIENFKNQLKMAKIKCEKKKRKRKTQLET